MPGKFIDVKKDQLGVSVIELMWVASLLIIVIGSIYSVLYSAMNTYLFCDRQSRATDNARIGLNMLVQDVRMAVVLNEAEPNLFQFEADIDDDGSRETLKYYLSGSSNNQELMRSVVDGTLTRVTPVAEYIVNNNQSPAVALFQYKDLNGVVPGEGNPEEYAQLVTIKLVVDVNPGAFPTQTVLQSDVKMRNR